MKVVAIIQARMGSTRLPGKVLKQVMNKPLLDYQIERLKRAKMLDDIVIATTVIERDKEIVRYCEERSLSYFKGSEQDVLSRYYEAAQNVNADVIVRITSDCPIIDPAVVDDVISHFLQDPSFDYVSNTIERTYPRGMDTEVFPFAVLNRVHQEATAYPDREHVTSYIVRHPHKFHIKQVKQETDESGFRLTVDTPEDLQVIEHILQHLYVQSPFFSQQDVIAFLKQRPDVVRLNENIQQKRS
ncbi:glycosyltransferase family protein [Bacillus sp. AGMB 02131]|uniref:Glycosyltransferase family protein n=1 Tax=Peribacillus faecalis TaxID=2772559 RepID=A0A927CXY4_9BACI|nr:glycosyltransferase family protein [Peribacillus faecalis]MBD3109666.1 glycosyltransferase family protein [Peribacillus faecalis]